MIASAAATAALTGPRTPLAPRMMADPSRTFGRCEPWASERATARQIVGVVGRFTDSASWRDRSSFATVDDASADTPLQAETDCIGACWPAWRGTMRDDPEEAGRVGSSGVGRLQKPNNLHWRGNLRSS